MFKADERGLYWEGVPSRMYLTKEEISASGWKPSKNGENVNGDQVLEPLVVWSSGSQRGPCGPMGPHQVSKEPQEKDGEIRGSQ